MIPHVLPDCSVQSLSQFKFCFIILSLISALTFHWFLHTSSCIQTSSKSISPKGTLFLNLRIVESFMCLIAFWLYSIHTIQGFHICTFACSLNLLMSPKSILTLLLWSFMAMCRMAKNLNCLNGMFPVEAEQGDAAPSVHSMVWLVPWFCSLVLFVGDLWRTCMFREALFRHELQCCWLWVQC